MSLFLIIFISKLLYCIVLHHSNIAHLFAVTKGEVHFLIQMSPLQGLEKSMFYLFTLCLRELSGDSSFLSLCVCVHFFLMKQKRKKRRGEKKLDVKVSRLVRIKLRSSS